MTRHPYHEPPALHRLQRIRRAIIRTLCVADGLPALSPNSPVLVRQELSGAIEDVRRLLKLLEGRP